MAYFANGWKLFVKKWLSSDLFHRLHLNMPLQVHLTIIDIERAEKNPFHREKEGKRNFLNIVEWRWIGFVEYARVVNRECVINRYAAFI